MSLKALLLNIKQKRIVHFHTSYNTQNRKIRMIIIGIPSIHPSLESFMTQNNDPLLDLALSNRTFYGDRDVLYLTIQYGSH